jgi:hypothetical protein
MNSRFHELKTQLKYLQAEMRKKLTKLSVQTENTISTMKKKKEKVKESVKSIFVGKNLLNFIFIYTKRQNI